MDDFGTDYVTCWETSGFTGRSADRAYYHFVGEWFFTGRGWFPGFNATGY